ncbi:MAG: manganese efflux pump MntP family protein [Oscillospiraceae bacterium]|jgi:putative Mn2+ efflux pump MntP|nr:manganese efflux pump MntP family protein [Oscillospiraceae bacterium]
MNFFDLMATAVALSMDAFAVSVSKGLSVKTLRPRHALITGTYFGGFQALMPLLGYFLARSFANYIQVFDHWIAFVLLASIGANMIREALSKDEETMNDSFGVKVMLPMAVATSIDAMAAGITFAMTGANILLAVALTGVTTFLFSAAGVKVGNVFGARYRAKAEFIGGIILVLMGTKILIEHLTV